jgi:hypothetical protein
MICPPNLFGKNDRAQIAEPLPGQFFHLRTALEKSAVCDCVLKHKLRLTARHFITKSLSVLDPPLPLLRITRRTEHRNKLQSFLARSRNRCRREIG